MSVACWARSSDPRTTMDTTDTDKPLVLIVDDVSVNLQVLGPMLRAEGWRISAATSGKQALSVVENVRPDLILLDVYMPGMNGFEVCRVLKDNEETRDIPVIFLTADGEKQTILEGFAIGAVDYVTKPFVAAELLARVRTHIALKRSRDELERTVAELNEALAEISTLRGIIPICAKCKNVRDDKGFWQQVECYVSDRSDAEFSHGVCPGCAQELYPELYKNRPGKGTSGNA